MGLVKAFNTLPDGSVLPEQSRRRIADIVDHLREKLLKPIGNGSDHERRRRMRERLDLLEDRGLPHFKQMIGKVFTDPTVKDERLAMLPYARFQNVTRRISGELAMVYKQDAKRFVSSGEGYKNFVEETQLDLEMREANRYIHVLNEVLIWIRAKPGGIPAVEVITPDSFSAVTHPLDPRELVAVIIDRRPDGPSVRDTDPRYELWSDNERLWLDKNYRIVDHSLRENPFGTIPGVLAHRRKPRRTVLDSDSGQDIIDAHYAVCLLNVMMLHGQKVGTKAPYTIGDMSRTPSGQPLDHDKVTQFEEGVSPGVMDLGHDPESLISSSRSTIGQVAANYGIPEDVFNLTHDASSGFDRRLKRWGLEERRQEQIPIFRSVEKRIAEVASAVMFFEGDPKYRFSTDGWRIDFGEVEAPQEPNSLLDWRKKARGMGLRTAIDDIMDDNPDITREQAEEQFRENLKRRTVEVAAQRALNMSQDPTSDPGESPEQNGGRPRSSNLKAVARRALMEVA